MKSLLHSLANFRSLCLSAFSGNDRRLFSLIVDIIIDYLAYTMLSVVVAIRQHSSLDVSICQHIQMMKREREKSNYRSLIDSLLLISRYTG